MPWALVQNGFCCFIISSSIYLFIYLFYFIYLFFGGGEGEEHIIEYGIIKFCFLKVLVFSIALFLYSIST